jgi:hypothetical protein
MHKEATDRPIPPSCWTCEHFDPRVIRIPFKRSCSTAGRTCNAGWRASAPRCCCGCRATASFLSPDRRGRQDTRGRYLVLIDAGRSQHSVVNTGNYTAKATGLFVACYRPLQGDRQAPFCGKVDVMHLPPIQRPSAPPPGHIPATSCRKTGPGWY